MSSHDFVEPSTYNFVALHNLLNPITRKAVINILKNQNIGDLNLVDDIHHQSGKELTLSYFIQQIVNRGSQFKAGDRVNILMDGNLGYSGENLDCVSIVKQILVSLFPEVKFFFYVAGSGNPAPEAKNTMKDETVELMGKSYILQAKYLSDIKKENNDISFFANKSSKVISKSVDDLKSIIKDPDESRTLSTSMSADTLFSNRNLGQSSSSSNQADQKADQNRDKGDSKTITKS